MLCALREAIRPQIDEYRNAYIAANLVVSTVAAVVAWHLVERRFLALKDVWGRRS